MSFDAQNFVIDKVRRVTRVNLTSGDVDFTLTNIQSPQVEFTGESTDKTDAQGVLIARFDTAKGVSFSGEASLLSMPLMAAQLGTDVEIATSGSKLTAKIFEVVKVVTTTDSSTPPVTTITATLAHTPKTAPAKVYILGSDKSIAGTIAIGSTASDASISGKVITFPSSFEATQVGVLYEYETAEAVMVVDSADAYDVAAQYLVDILAADVCNPSQKRAGTLVFPKAKMDNNFSLDLTTEGTHPFGFTALADYCEEDVQLCYIIFNK